MNEKEIITEKKVDSILALKKKDSVYADIAHGFSYFFHKKKQNYALAIKYGLIEIETFDSLKILNKKHTNALYNLGMFYHKKKLLNTSVDYYKKAIKSNKFPRKVAQSYCALGHMLYRKGKYFESMDYFLKGLPLLEKHSLETSLVFHYSRFSNNCNKMNTQEATELGLYYLKKGDSIIQNSKNFNKNSILPYYINTGLANLYSLKHQYNFKKAEHYYKKDLDKAYKEKDNYIISLTSLNLGELYLNRKKDSCMFYFNESLKYDYEKYNLYETYLNISIFHFTKKDYLKALININKSIEGNFNDKGKITTLTNKDLLDVKDQRSLIKALKMKLIILLSLNKQNNETSYLKLASKTVNLTNKIIKLLIEYSNNTDTDFLWRSDVSEIFNLGIQAAYLLNKPELMLQFMEENKAFLLTQNIKDNHNFSNLPEEISLKNIELKKSILTLQNKINLHEASQKRDSLLSLKIHHENFLDSIQKKYPELKKQNQNIKTITLSDLKTKLANNDVVMYYALSKNGVDDNQKSLFGLFVSKEFNHIFKVENTAEALNLLEQYKKLLSKPLITKPALKTFKNSAYSLYSQLFPTNEIRELIKNKNLILVPDVNLENIPFEALNTNKTGLNYLIENSNISYAYSMSFLDFNKKRKRKKEYDFTGLAPINFQNKKLTPLTHTKKELNTIENLISKSDIYIDNDATKETFLNSTENSKIIHLATHAQTNPKPVIYFNKDSLNLHELYTYKNNADLVVLSACETNLGEIKKGEGTLSLARGFFYSGANSVISSLWNVNDASTTFLMKNFYSNLTNNQTKVDALTNAKRKYLKEHSLSERSPYYWASFVLIGDTSKTFEKDYSLYFFFGFIIFLIAIFLFFKIKK